MRAYFKSVISRGISLVEIIFAVSIVGFIIMIMVNILPGAMLGIKKVEHRIRAASIAQGILEEKRSGPFNSIDAAPTPTKITDQDGTVYTIAFNPLPSRPGTDGTKLKGLQVTVFWKDHHKDLSVTRELWVCNVPQ